MNNKPWVQEKWVDIGSPKKDRKWKPCERSKENGSMRGLNYGS